MPLPDEWLAEAATIDPSDVAARRAFVRRVSGSGHFERGKTSRELAALWGRDMTTISADFSLAWKGGLANLDEYAKAEMVDQYEAAKADKRETDEWIAVMPPQTIREVKDVAEARKANAETAAKLVEMIGRASGAISSGTTVLIDQRGNLAPPLAAIANAIASACARMDPYSAGVLRESLLAMGTTGSVAPVAAALAEAVVVDVEPDEDDEPGSVGEAMRVGRALCGSDDPAECAAALRAAAELLEGEAS